MKKNEYIKWQEENSLLRIQVLGQTSDCQLSWAERVVYSYLVWRIKKKSSAKTADIQNGTGLSWNSVANSLKKLEHYGLAEKGNAGYLAREPQEETAGWFPRRQCDSIQWFDHFAYVWVPIPSDNGSALLDRPITLLESYVWSYYQTAKGDKSIRNISRMTGVSREKISATLKKCKALEAALKLSPDLFLEVGERKKRSVSPEAKQKMLANREADKLYNALGKPEVFEYFKMPVRARRQVLLPLAELCDHYSEGSRGRADQQRDICKVMNDALRHAKNGKAPIVSPVGFINKMLEPHMQEWMDKAVEHWQWRESRKVTATPADSPDQRSNKALPVIESKRQVEQEEGKRQEAGKQRANGTGIKIEEPDCDSAPDPFGLEDMDWSECE